MQFDREVEAGAEDVLAEESVFLGLSERGLQVQGHLRRVVPGVDVALLRAYGIGAYDQALEHLVRIAGEHGPVHEGRRLALVPVDDDVLGLLRRVLGGLPFQAGGEAAAAAAAQIGLLHLLQHLVRAHLGERLGQRGVAADRKVVVDAHRVHLRDVADQDAHLVLVERHLAHVHRLLAGDRMVVDQALDHLALERALDDLRRVFRLDFEVADVARPGDDIRSLVAKAVAAGAPEVQPGFGGLLFDFRSEGGDDGGGVQSPAGGTGTHGDAGLGRIPGRQDLRPVVFQCSR